MSTRTLIFRADGNSSYIDTVNKCIVLAHEHQRRGGKCHLLLSNLLESTKKQITDLELDYSILDAAPGTETDLEYTLWIANKSDNPSIVVSGQKFGQSYLKKLAAQHFTLVLASGDDRTLPVQVVVNDCFSADERSYTCRADTNLLLGPKFKVIPTNLGKETEKNTENIKRSLVSTSDDHATARLLDNLPSPKELEILQVVGDHSCKILAEACKYACARGYIVEQISYDNIASLIPSTNFAICSPGAILDALAYLSIPTLVVATSSLEYHDARRLNEELASESLLALPRSSDASIAFALEEFMSQPPKGNRLSQLVDGEGANRILDSLDEYKIEAPLLKAA